MPVSKHKSGYLLLSFIILVALIWFTRIQLSEIFLPATLEHYGASNAIIDIKHLGLEQSEIRHFETTIATAGAEIAVAARDIQINYQPGHDSQSHIDSIIIEQLALHYRRKPVAPRSEDTSANKRVSTRILEIIRSMQQLIVDQPYIQFIVINNLTLDEETYKLLQHNQPAVNTPGENKRPGDGKSSIDHENSQFLKGLYPLVIIKASDNTVSLQLKHSPIAAEPEKIGPVIADIEISMDSAQMTGKYHLMPEYLVEWIKPVTDLSDMALTEEISGTVNLVIQPEKEINASLSVVSDKFIYRDWSASSADIKLNINIPETQEHNHIELISGSYLKARHIGRNKLSVNNSQINATAQFTDKSGQWSYDADIRLPDMRADYDSHSLKIKNFDARTTANTENLDIQGKFMTAGLAAHFNYALTHSFTAQKGNLSIIPVNSINLDTGDSRISQLFESWPYAFDLLSGKVKLSSYASWSDNSPLRLRSAVSFDQVGGNAGKHLFSGLSLAHEFNILPQLASVNSSRINIATIDSGVTISQLGFDISLTSAQPATLPVVNIHDMQGNIFNGQFSAGTIVYNPNHGVNRFTINTSGIDLAELVKTQQMDGIEITGQIDGTLPVEINEHGVFITNGLFVNNLKNGTIRYKPAVVSDRLKQSQLTGIALDALKDFRYTHLAAAVKYVPEGNLAVNIELKGSSPELDTTRPVHLNINSEQNLLSLLKSLRYAQGLNESINDKVRRLYETQH